MSAPGLTPAATAFDRLAADYQRACDNDLFAAMRATVHARWTELLSPGQRVLEVGCGIGLDSCFLAARGVSVVAVDPAPAMVDATRRRVAAEGCGGQVRLEQAGLDGLPALLDAADVPPFDLIVSNFGALNCAADLSPLRLVATRHLRPGGRLSLGLMSRYCAWEMAYYFARLRPREALRRVGPSPRMVMVEGVRVPTYYHQVGDVAAALGAGYRVRGVLGLAVCVPPPWLAGGWARVPARFRHLAQHLDGRLAPHWPFNRLGDHFLLEVDAG